MRNYMFKDLIWGEKRYLMKTGSELVQRSWVDVQLVQWVTVIDIEALTPADIYSMIFMKMYHEVECKK